MLHQPITLPAAAIRAGPARKREWGLWLFLAAAALFLYWDAGNSPITLWDESRNIVSALEMRQTGLSLVTTYGFAPDLWNTKPPLLIWLIYVSVEIFGPSVWALRVPSMLAALGMLFLTYKAAERVTGSPATGAFAGTILLLSPGFFSIHAARTADYDALLAFFTTAYLFLLYRLVGQRRPTPLLAGLAGLLIAAAVLTKSISGLIPLAGVGLYLLTTGRLGRIVLSYRHWLIVLCAAAPVILFYAAREAAGPGYLEAANQYDFLGRFNTPVIGRAAPFTYYATNMLSGWLALGPLLLALPVGWKVAPPKAKAMARYCILVSALPLLVLSLSSTKLPHYMLSFYPLLAVAAAILLPAAYRRLAGLRPVALGTSLRLVGAATFLLLCAHNAHWRMASLPVVQSVAGSDYGALFEALEERGVARVSIIDNGFKLDGVAQFGLAPVPHYHAVLRSYQLLWAERSLIATRGGSAPVVASCDPRVVPTLQGRSVVRVSGCLAVRRD